MTSDPWKELGYAIRTARLGHGWSLEDLAGEALGNPARKSYVGQVENGLRNLSPETIDKFDQALDLPADIVKAAHMAPPPGQGTPAPPQHDVDALSEKLMQLAEQQGRADTLRDEGITEKAIIRLAQRISASTDDLGQAWLNLQNAMDIAVRVQAEGQGGSNHGDFVDTVLARVAELSRDGAYTEAGDAIEAALAEQQAKTLGSGSV